MSASAPVEELTPDVPAAPRPSRAASLVRAARPRQWVKNLLVFAAPAAGGVLGHRDVIWSAIGAFVAFCLVSSATYMLNDLVDADADRRHPVKRPRPIAAGPVSGSSSVTGFGAPSGSGSRASSGRPVGAGSSSVRSWDMRPPVLPQLLLLSHDAHASAPPSG